MVNVFPNTLSRLVISLALFMTVVSFINCNDNSEPCPEIDFTTRTFSINENTPAGTMVGNLNLDFEGSYAFAAGNELGVFSINDSGEITVASNTLLDYEQYEYFELIAQVSVPDCGNQSIDVVINIEDEVDEIYRDPVFEEVTVDRSVVYGDADADDQYMNVYYPTMSQERRPLLVIGRGGSTSGGSLDFLEDIGQTLAKAGYVVAAINYKTDKTGELNNFVRNILSTQDFRAAIRFFRRDAEENDLYKVNTDNIFHGGFSSGGNRAFELAYQDEQNYSSVELGIISTLGGLEGERGNPGYSSDTKAYLNMGGSTQKIDWMDAGEIPVVAIHSNNDPEVPYEFANGSYGSKAMTDRAEELGIDNRLITIFNPPADQSHDAPAFCIECFDDVLTFFAQYLD